MAPPKSLTGLQASVEVQTRDLYSALRAVSAHRGPKEDIPLLQAVHLTIHPDGNVYVEATDRYTVGIAVVSIWEAHVANL